MLGNERRDIFVGDDHASFTGKILARVRTELVKQTRADQHMATIDTATNLHSVMERRA